MANCSISLCMIACDEERFIGGALGSVASLVDEIIVVDGGSSDGTKELASGAGARVFERPWNDDFAAARNFSLTKAKSDWILVLDADEALAQSDSQRIQALVRNPCSCYVLTQRHYTDDFSASDFLPAQGEYPEWERHYRGFFTSTAVRLFPRHSKLKYSGRIHEGVEQSAIRLKIPIVPTDIPIHHYGMTPEVVERKKKRARYRALSLQKAVEQSNDWRAWYELALEFNQAGQYEEAAEAFRRSIRMNERFVKSYLGVSIALLKLNLPREALQILTIALRLVPEDPEVLCQIGVAYNGLGEFQLARQAFCAAVRQRPSFAFAVWNLGQSYLRAGMAEEAATSIRRLSEIMPANSRGSMQSAGPEHLARCSKMPQGSRTGNQ